MRVVFTLKITDELIKSKVVDMVTELEEDDVIRFPDDTTRNEFIDEVTDIICDKYSERGYYEPDYESEVLDLANLYGLGKE